MWKFKEQLNNENKGNNIENYLKEHLNKNIESPYNIIEKNFNPYSNNQRRINNERKTLNLLKIRRTNKKSPVGFYFFLGECLVISRILLATMFFYTLLLASLTEWRCHEVTLLLMWLFLQLSQWSRIMWIWTFCDSLCLITEIMSFWWLSNNNTLLWMFDWIARYLRGSRFYQKSSSVMG